MDVSIHLLCIWLSMVVSVFFVDVHYTWILSLNGYLAIYAAPNDDFLCYVNSYFDVDL